MAYIYTDVTNRLILGNEEYARKTNLPGSLWTKVRLAMRYCVQDTGGNITTPSFSMGLCEGITAGKTLRGTSTTGYLGIGWLNLNWNRGISGFSSLPLYAWENNALYIIQRTGSTTTSVTSGMSYIYAQVAPRPNMLIMDIIRTGPTTFGLNTLQGYNLSGADPYPIVDQYTFMTYVDRETFAASNDPPGYQWSNNFIFGTYTGSSFNALDTVSINWTKATPAMEILDVVLLKFN